MMNRFNFWSGTGGSTSDSASINGSSKMSEQEEIVHLEKAIGALDMIMNDDLDGANTILEESDSAFHKVGRAVITFLQATLGVEKDVLREASDRLVVAEAVSSEYHRLSLRDPNAYKSKIYAPGTEYALLHAQSQVMSAVVGVMSESLTESVKGFYKLRKAFMTLDAISEQERKYLKKSGIDVEEFEKSEMPGGQTDVQALDKVPSASNGAPPKDKEVENDEDDFQDAEEEQSNPTDTSAQIPQTSTSAASSINKTTSTSRIDSPFTKHPIDAFIHTSNSLQFGTLLLLISLIPPAFSPLLAILSFRGDRIRALSLLWRTAHSTNTTGGRNINAVIASLTLLEFYALVAVEIAPASAYPRARLTSILESMRSLYPDSKLWYLQSARMLSSNRRLEEAYTMLTDPTRDFKSPLKQVEGFHAFETSLDCMYLYRYAEAAAWFQELPSINKWSPGLYYYLAASCYLELYRIDTHGDDPDPTLAAHFAALATSLFEKIPAHAGKKKFLARQLPFEVLITRKYAKWSKLAAERGIPLVDAIGPSPMVEMSFLWNGLARMQPQHLHESLRRLAVSDGGKGADAEVEGEASSSPATATAALELQADDTALLGLLRGSIYRHLGKIHAARKMLNGVFLQPGHWAALKRVENGDRYTAPLARYELAVGYWREAEGLGEGEGEKGGGADTGATTPEEVEKKRRGLLQKCASLLEEVAKWETYDLEARMGMKVTTGRETLKRLGVTGGG